MNSKLRFSVYGNCQAAALAGQMLAHPAFAARYDYVPIEPCFSVTQPTIEAWVREHRGSIDLLVAHNLNPGWRGHPAWDVDTVAQALRPGGRLVRYADIYFRGVNPLLVYPKTFARPAHCDYTDLITLTMAAHGFGDAGVCAALYQDARLLDASEIEAAMDLAEAEMMRREAGLEVQASRDIASLCRQRPAFHTFNHPGNEALELVAQSVFRAAGLSDAQARVLPGELLQTVRIPLPACVREHYRRCGVDAGSLPADIVSLERGEPMSVRDYFEIALAAVVPHGPQVLMQELDRHRQDRVSAAVIRGIERGLCNMLSMSPAVLAEVGQLNARGITPDFLLNKADPQAVGFMVDLLAALRQALLPRLSGSRLSVLDLGAKSGAGSELMAYLGQTGSFSKMKFEVTCADIDSTYVAYCRAKHPHVEYLNADVFEAGRLWDVVLCSHVIEHVPNPIDFVRRLRGITRRFIVLAFPYVEDPGQLIPGHLHSLDHHFLRALGPVRYEIYEGLFWSQSMCCIAIIDCRD